MDGALSGERGVREPGGRVVLVVEKVIDLERQLKVPGEVIMGAEVGDGVAG